MMGFIFIALLSLSFAASLIILGRGTRETLVQKRLTALERRSQTRSAPQSDLSLLEGVGKQSWAALGYLLTRCGAMAPLRTLLLQTGSAWTLRRLGCSALLCAVLAGASAELVLRSAPASALCGFGGGTLPLLWLRMRRKGRLARFEAALPDAIDLMARSLRAGHSISAALEIVADRCPEPLAGEFSQVCQQQRLGAMFRESVLDLAHRVPSHDLRFLVTGMLVQRESGGDLTEILDSIRRVIADRLRIYGMVRVQSAQGRLTGWILSALPAILFILMSFLNPSYTGMLIHDPRGRELLWAGSGLIAIGMVTIRKIVAVKV